MMELFSEVFGAYYQIVSEILAKAPLTTPEIQKLVSESGFAESALHFIPHLLDEGDWPFLEEKDGLWCSRLEHPPHMPVTNLELRWLRAILEDPRARLFFTDLQWGSLMDRLSGVPPLFDWGQFYYFDRCLDGDAYQTEEYRRIFQKILAAIRASAVVEVTYSSDGSRREKTQAVLPLRLEYSEKDDKFRVFCARVRDGGLLGYTVLNLGRIGVVNSSAEHYDGPLDLDGWIARCRCREPVVLEVRTERNGVERFLVEFSAYEKQSEYDKKNDVCRVTLWYSKRDETEVLIRILGFGPVVRVLSPDSFVDKVRQRVLRQRRLLQEKTRKEP